MEEARHAAVLIHVCDRSNPLWEKQRDTVRRELRALGCGQTPVVEVWNKMDRVSPAMLASNNTHSSPNVSVQVSEPVWNQSVTVFCTPSPSMSAASSSLCTYTISSAVSQNITVVSEAKKTPTLIEGSNSTQKSKKIKKIKKLAHAPRIPDLHNYSHFVDTDTNIEYACLADDAEGDTVGKSVEYSSPTTVLSPTPTPLSASLQQQQQQSHSSVAHSQLHHVHHAGECSLPDSNHPNHSEGVSNSMRDEGLDCVPPETIIVAASCRTGFGMTDVLKAVKKCLKQQVSQ